MAARTGEGQWEARPWLAALVRTLVVGIPVFAGWSTARLVTLVVADWPNAWARVVGVLTAALLVSVLASRFTSRFLPLAVLLRMTMLFPDKAPSRMKVARRTTSLADIKSRLASTRLDEQEAAATMLALVTALGRHDRHTRGHSERVRLFCDLLSKELGLSVADSGRLRWAALIHDIGKLEIPAVVLNKPGKLDSREWDLIRSHPDAGARLAAPLQEWLGPWFAGIPEHHEKYDGSGYPRGLIATAISASGRAIAVVDAFETMTAARSYKSARSTLSARAELTKCAGSHFDPVMVRAFLAISLPRLLWSVGPLAFLVNLPYLQAIGESGVRLGSAVGTTTVAATNVAGVTAVAMAVSAAPTASATPASAPRPSSPASVGRSTAAAPRATPARPKPTDALRPGAHKAVPPHLAKKAAKKAAQKAPKKAAKPAKKAAPMKSAKPGKKAPAGEATMPVGSPKPAPKPASGSQHPTAAQVRAAWLAWLAHHPKHHHHKHH